MDDPAGASDGEPVARLLLARLGAAMIATGRPAHEVERELAEVGAGWIEGPLRTVPPALAPPPCCPAP